jgi:hypothetical protein
VHKWLIALLMSCLSKTLTRLSALAVLLCPVQGETSKQLLSDKELYLNVKHVSHHSVEEPRVFGRRQAGVGFGWLGVFGAFVTVRRW